MKHVRLAALAVLAVGLGAGVAEAGSINNAKIALHLVTPSVKTTAICTTTNPIVQNIACSSYNPTGAILTYYTMYLVIGQIVSPDDTLAGGIRGLALGIKYTTPTGTVGTSVSWTSCGDLEFPNGNPLWPESGGGNTITWADCKGTDIPPDGSHVLAGAFTVYAYAADTFQITANNNLANAALAIANCSGAQVETPLDHAGFVRFGGLLGCNPCLAPCFVPVAPTTWGKIKSQYH
jgi:hypothetical protein